MADRYYYYDVLMMMVCLQGKLNAEKPTIFVDDGANSVHDTYFTYMRQKEGDVLYGYKKQEISNVDDFLTIFKDDIVRLGLTVWDRKVPATSNVAATVCGIDGNIPVSGDSSLFTYLTETLGAEIKLDLRGKFTGKGTVWQTDRKSTGSAKCDAYAWALEKYMDQCDDEYLGYICDAYPISKEGQENPFSYNTNATMLADLDFLIMKKAFIYDLYVWEDCRAPDEKTQPVGTDYKMYVEILRRNYEKNNGTKMTQIVGFPQIFYKYGTPSWGTDEEFLHDNTATEFRFVELASQFNCVVDADCGGYFSTYNCSIYTKHELKEKYTNSKPESIPEYNPDKIYAMFYMGDYDSCAWMTQRVPSMWKDNARGSVPLAWPFNPNLSVRNPVVFDYVRTYATENDYFIGGDSGAGYLNPSLLEQSSRKDSNLPDAFDLWAEWNKKFYDQFDLSITGFVHNGAINLGSTNDPALEVYKRFSPDGLASYNFSATRKFMIGDMPAIGFAPCVISQNQTAAEAVQKMSEVIDQQRDPKFCYFLTNCATPLQMKAAVTQLSKTYSNVEVVDPYTFFALLSKALTE